MSTPTLPSTSTPPSTESVHADEDAVHIEPLDFMLHIDRPELIVLELLQHTAVTAYRALGLVHPEIHGRGDIEDLPDEDCYYASLIAAELLELLELLPKYRAAAEYTFHEDGGPDELDEPGEPDDIELPF